MTHDGRNFGKFEEYKKILLSDEQVHGRISRHLISRLIVYATGGEIQFADRDVVEEIANKIKGDGFPIRDMIHQIVQSKLFKNK